MPENDGILLQAEGLTRLYPVKGGILNRTVGHIHAAEDVTFTLRRGETLGLVGESGCGKSTVGRLLAGLEKPDAGRVLYNGADLSDPAALAAVRTEIQLVFQDNYSALNPRKTVFHILSEPMLYHGICTKENADTEVSRLLDLVGLPGSVKNRYPHEFSGGQRQRIGIAKALSLNPKLLICDEPVSALDVSVQAQILNLLRELKQSLGLTAVFIGHGLPAVGYVSDRIAVMYLGQLVELAPARELFAHPQHPYTKALLNAVPVPDPERRSDRSALVTGEARSAIDPPAGCRFAPRCPFACDACRQGTPRLAPIAPGSGHYAACTAAAKEGEQC